MAIGYLAPLMLVPAIEWVMRGYAQGDDRS